MNDKMDCKQVLELLAGDYLDNELDPAARGQVDRHLAQCPACRQAGERLASIARPLRQARNINVPPGVWTKIKAEVTREHARHAGLKTPVSSNALDIFMMRPAFAAAAAAAILILASAAFFMHTARTPGAATAAANGASVADNLNLLTGNIEVRNQHAGFGSCLEQLLL